MIKMMNKTLSGNPTSQVTINVPVSRKTGKISPVRMTNYIYEDDDIVVTEFLLLYDLLPQIPSAILDLYK